MPRNKALSADLRKGILNLSAESNSGCRIAKTLGLTRYTVQDIIKYHRETGLIAAKQRFKRSSAITDAELRILGRLVKKDRRASFTALTAVWNESMKKNQNTPYYVH
ncbi:hypothetical protein ILUMI_05676 [Ignelater luminosus]|uniref:Uncharacterized protein n=1 Tax=Ignelater luminosus TaxID=2038154 RepID=A0A8K0GHX3_IGNLU|nr:hypothetical protein ILUMI_05676 [Ignelater luminosus]